MQPASAAFRSAPSSKPRGAHGVLDQPVQRHGHSRWYGEDFGRTEEERLLFIAPYLYRNEERQYLERNAGRFRVKYDSYDWRLNRT